MNEHQVMALAAMCLAAKQVQKVAQFGNHNEHDLEILLSSIVKTSPPTPEDVYQCTLELHQPTNILNNLNVFLRPSC